MAARANWKGYLKIAELCCPVGLYTAASAAERIAFHTVDRATGHRIVRQFVDQETGDVVPAEDQVKGYDTGHGDHVVLDPAEIATAIPQADKTLDVQSFVACQDIDQVYFDRPYYLAPSDADAAPVFTLIRDGLMQRKVAALARTVMFRRMRSLLIRPHGSGLIAHTLNFDYEVRAAAESFGAIPEITIKGEMLDLAKHIIGTKAGAFDAAGFDDRYEAALGELVRAKLEGRPIARPAKQAAFKAVDLIEALRQSAGRTAPAPSKRKAPAAKPPARRKAG